jgi:TM2 domain-containing membrane protein YozV
MAKRGKSKITVNKRTIGKAKRVNWLLVLIMSILFGAIGVDRFIMGKVGTGILKLITLGGLGFWYIIDIILIAIKYKFKGIVWVD